MEIIPSTLRFTLIVGVICYFIIILYYLKQRVLNLKYTLLWLLAGVVMGLFVVFPELLVYMTRLFNIEDNMNGLFIMCIAFIVMILMAITSIVSKLDRKVRKLTQEMGMMDMRIRDLEKNKEEMQ